MSKDSATPPNDAKVAASPKVPMEPRYDDYILNIGRHVVAELDNFDKTEQMYRAKVRAGEMDASLAGWIMHKRRYSPSRAAGVIFRARATSGLHSIVRESRPEFQTFAVCSCGLMVPTNLPNLAVGEERDLTDTREEESEARYPGFLDAPGHRLGPADSEPSDYWRALQEGGAFDE